MLNCDYELWVNTLFPCGPEPFRPNPHCPRCRAALKVGLKYYDCPDCKQRLVLLGDKI